MSVRRHETSGRDAECGLGSVNSEFRGEVWAGENYLQLTNTHRCFEPQPVSLFCDTPGLSAELGTGKGFIHMC